MDKEYFEQGKKFSVGASNCYYDIEKNILVCSYNGIRHYEVMSISEIGSVVKTPNGLQQYYFAKCSLRLWV